MWRFNQTSGQEFWSEPSLRRRFHLSTWSRLMLSHPFVIILGKLLWAHTSLDMTENTVTWWNILYSSHITLPSPFMFSPQIPSGIGVRLHFGSVASRCVWTLFYIIGFTRKISLISYRPDHSIQSQQDTRIGKVFYGHVLAEQVPLSRTNNSHSPQDLSPKF